MTQIRMWQIQWKSYRQIITFNGSFKDVDRTMNKLQRSGIWNFLKVQVGLSMKGISNNEPWTRKFGLELMLCKGERKEVLYSAMDFSYTIP